MKKLFNYALLAAALLVGVNVNAETKVIEVSDLSTLQTVFDEAASGDIIQITTKDMQTTFPSTITLDDAKVWTLDLNGRNLVYTNAEAATAEAGSMFILKQGVLHVQNGTITNATPTTNHEKTAKGGSIRCFYVFGQNKANAVNGTELSQKLAVYPTQLYIGEDVFVDCTYGKDAIEIYRNYIEPSRTITGGNKKDRLGGAFGVYVQVDGKLHGEKYAVQMSGTVNATPEDLVTYSQDVIETTGEKYNWPWLVISKTAEVYSNPTTTVQGGVGLYMGGYGICDIYGYVHGATGVYIKNGDITIEDAIIASDYTGEFAAAQNGGSSTEGGGSAVVIVTNGNTYGGIDVTVGGDTKITGGSGYGIEEDVNKKDDNYSSLAGLNIEGGTIESGDKGGIVITDDTKDHNVLVISGGSSEGTVEVGKAGEGTTETPIDNFLEKDEEGNPKGHVTVIDNGDGTTTTVVTNGPAPDKKTLETENAIMSYPGQSIDFNGSTVEQVVSADLTLKEVNMVHATNNEKMTVNDGATLRVERLIMGPKANITVAKGGTLIVDGAQGIVANADGNIVIQAQEGQMGQFLFNPAVTSNRHPVATLTYYSKAFRNSAENQQQDLIGIPMNAVSNITISDNSKSIVFDVWRKTYWDRIGGINFTPSLADNYAKFDVPFGLYCMYSNTDSEHLLSCNITGNLLGNTEPSSIRVLKGWTSAANSWTGDIDFDAIIKALNDNHFNGLTKSIYLGKIEGSAITWNAFNELTDDNPTVVEPMQAMMLNNTGANAVDARILTYKELVWDPVMESEPITPSAPRATQNINKVSVRISSQEGVTDRVVIGEMDEVFNAPKYMENPVCVYAHADENYDIFATSAIENTFIGFNTNKAGIYTVSFGTVNGNYALVDTKTNARIEMVKGNTYEFLAEAGEDAYRFQIVAGAQAPTAMQKTNAAVKATRALINGQIVISNGERFFNVLGAEVK